MDMYVCTGHVNGHGCMHRAYQWTCMLVVASAQVTTRCSVLGRNVQQRVHVPKTSPQPTTTHHNPPYTIRHSSKELLPTFPPRLHLLGSSATSDNQAVGTLDMDRLVHTIRIVYHAYTIPQALSKPIAVHCSRRDATCELDHSGSRADAD